MYYEESINRFIIDSYDLYFLVELFIFCIENLVCYYYIGDLYFL